MYPLRKGLVLKKKLALVDISSFIFRAFYAIRPLSAPDGTPVNAVHGVFSMLLKLLSEHRPTHVLVTRDAGRGTFRSEIYPEYKANRGETPEELIPQFPLIEELLTKMKMPEYMEKGFEADDLIGSAIVQYRDEFDEIHIVTGDKDLMQFVDGEKVFLLDTMKDKLYDPAAVKEKMGVFPEKIVDYLSIVGDSSDNVPGIKGLGPKGAINLIEKYGSLENILEHKDEVLAKRQHNALVEFGEMGLLSKKLITICTDVKIPQSASELAFVFRPAQELYDFFTRLGFKSTVSKLKELDYVDAKVEEVETAVVVPHMQAELIDSENLGPVISLLNVETLFYIHPVWLEADPLKPQLSALGLATAGRVFQIQYSLLESEQQLHLLRKLIQNHKKIIGFDLKLFLRFLSLHHLALEASIADMKQGSFCIDPAAKHDLAFIGPRYGFEICEGEEGAVQADLMQKIWKRMEEELVGLEVDKIFYELDMPALRVIEEMERNGICFDAPSLNSLANVVGDELANIEEAISKEVGESINLRSPKQVAHLLFEVLELPVLKKNKSGPSTNAEVLEELALSYDSHICSLILRYRELEKLQSTYINVLPQLVRTDTGRLHTSFHQDVAATGRLSSDTPNLQNIPVKSEQGRMIRRAFVAQEGKTLLSADYSQIELRILAHFCLDATMVSAFVHDEDVHAQTAAEVFGVPLDKVSREQRAQAKTINFGLIYGQSSFGLAGSLHISRADAKKYIEQYFEKFGQVKAFLDSLREDCERTGYAQTLWGRKRKIADIHAQNRNIKAFAERMSINSPIQGTAADIIKRAMVDIACALQEKELRSKILLQVHDELILEVEENELEQVQVLVREKMEGAAQLSVPLKVDMNTGKNWYELK